MMRAAALSRLGRRDDAKAVIDQLLVLEPEFNQRGRKLVSRYLKVDSLIDKVFDGLRKAGLADLS